MIVRTCVRCPRRLSEDDESVGLADGSVICNACASAILSEVDFEQVA
ncbi:DNA binding protein [Gordonia phage Morgana]|uniref:DNA binding protein n=1 Tax=Gordonia phage Morgana TaxID=3137292 RepID=A0AAX4RAX4_9CAUD